MAVRSYVRRDKIHVADRLNSKRFYRRLMRSRRKAAHRSVASKSKEIANAVRRFFKRRRLAGLLQDQPREIIECEKFSLIDEPDKTLQLLGEIAAADDNQRPYRVNFSDKKCLDIAPYMIFGLMRQQMDEELCQGGTIRRIWRRHFREASGYS